MLMVHIGSLSSTPKPHGLLQRDLQLIHLTYLALHVNLLILLMSHLTPTINCSKIRMVKYLLDMLALTAGTVLLKKIWVPKRCLESLQVNVLMTPPVKNRNPRSNSSYGPNSSYGSKSSYGPNSSHGSNSSKGSKSSYEHHRANNSVSQGRAKGYEYEHYSSNHYVHKSSKNFSAYSYAYPNPSYVKRTRLASMPPFSYGARRVMNSLPPLQMWVVKKKN